MDSLFAPLHTALVNRLEACGPDATSLKRRVEQTTVGEGAGGNSNSALDQALLDQLHTQGWLPQPVRVRAVPLTHHSRMEHHGALKVSSTIHLSQDGHGRVAPLVPGDDLGPWEDRPSHNSWSHWATLLHEAAHTVGMRLARPFQAEHLDPDVVDDLNALLLGPLATPSTRQDGFFHRCLQENFADVYSVMLLHRLAPDEPGVAQEVDNLIWGRRTMRERDFDPHLAKRQLLMSLPHQTDVAVARAWAERERWQDLAPESMVQAACALASHGVLELMRPGRRLGNGEVVLDDRLIQVATREIKDFLHTSPLVDLVAHDLAAPQRSRLSQWRGAYPSHPAWALMDHLAGKLVPEGTTLMQTYPGATLDERVVRARAFMDRGLRSKGATLRAEIQDRACVVEEQLKTVLGKLPPTPARRQRGP